MGWAVQWEGLKFFSSTGWKETTQSPASCVPEPEGAGELLCILLAAAAVLTSFVYRSLLWASARRGAPHASLHHGPQSAEDMAVCSWTVFFSENDF